MNGKFRKSAAGFNKADVTNFIREYSEEKQKQIDDLEAKVEELEAQKQELTEQIDELKAEKQEVETVLIKIHKEKNELQEKLRSRATVIRKNTDTNKEISED